MRKFVCSVQVQRNACKLNMDTYDILDDQFLDAGRSWIKL